MARPSEPLAEQIGTLYAHINAATFELLELIAEFDARGCYVDFNTRSTAAWLNYACGIALGAAREKVRVARALKELPKTSAAFRAGRLSYSKARAITRVATVVDEERLLNIAFHATASQTERIIRDYRRALTCDLIAERVLLERALTTYWDDQGQLVVRARLNPDQGALFLKALERACPPPPPRQPEPPGSPFAPSEADTIAARRADALVRVAERALENEGGGSTADRYQVTVHVSADTLAGEKTDETDEPASMENGPVISTAMAERLCCDGTLIPMLESGEGEPLSVGRKTRVVSPALRRALQRRDRGCRFPGCDEARYVDAHHIHHWAHGGETRLDNLVLLCRRHHSLLHEGGYRIVRAGDAILFKDAQGRCLLPTGEDLTRGDVATLLQRVSAETPLGGRSLTPKMDAGPVDYGYVCEVLLTNRGRPFNGPEPLPS